jgi:hypothetical protein
LWTNVAIACLGGRIGKQLIGVLTGGVGTKRSHAVRVLNEPLESPINCPKEAEKGVVGHPLQGIK